MRNSSAEPVEPQSARSVLMLRPAFFSGNPATAASNAFQVYDATVAKAAVHNEAEREFEALAQALLQAGVDVCVFDDTPQPHKPDAIFPNNWVSFHADGTVVLYPMLTENRRSERRMDLIERLAATHGFQVRRLIDLTAHEHAGEF